MNFSQNKKIYFSAFALSLTMPFFSFALSATTTTSTTTPPTFCSDRKSSCAPILNFATSTATTTKQIVKKYKIPKEGLRIAPSEANYSVFPEHLNFTVKDRNILLISRYWQTGCLYDTQGNIMKVASTSNRYICMQTATGKKELPTELGLYNIQTKQNKDYTSTKYTISGKEITSTTTEKSAPMPFAMHFGRIIGKVEGEKLLYDFSDGSALHEKQTINKYGSIGFVSHGCIAIEKGKGKFLQSIINYGDLILVFNQNVPTSLDAAISLDK